jgi:poly(A) polymerase
MQEIWLLQSRLSQRQPKRVSRLLAHPRFRASFDFLVLRQFASNEHAEEVAFWQEAQTHMPAEHEPMTDSEVADAADEAVGEESGAPKKRRRRRRRTVASE